VLQDVDHITHGCCLGLGKSCCQPWKQSLSEPIFPGRFSTGGLPWRVLALSGGRLGRMARGAPGLSPLRGGVGEARLGWDGGAAAVLMERGR
jgi:hypothetical protein